ncbi:pentatricopeptide repeat (PPR) superfamily protein [Actinidia rufa]|uniref:Pentatricopeptide repeat (PPR) superfamily protein n=1 Tax=Actinidia rufa TaxID=165716 RepID=A0A7J0GGY2_9ERIC|nr:pentatricopeptide repeat (PPR) superfamily protein [Actinidia rufa]
MLFEEFVPNEFTACSVLNACGDEKALMFGRQLYGAIVKKLFKNDVYIGTSLVDMHAKCGEIADSRKVFDGMRKRNMVMWISIIAGYTRNGLGEEAISLFQGMWLGWRSTVGKGGSCSTSQELFSKQYLRRNRSCVALLQMHGILYCIQILQDLPFKDVVSCTVMISGCAGLGHEPEALEFFKEMRCRAKPLYLSSALKACAR